MIPARIAIHRTRRDLVLARVVRVLFVMAAVLCAAVAPFTSGSFDGYLLLVLIGGAWLALSYRSMKGSQYVANSPHLIAAGQFDEAERQIEHSLRSFSIFKTVKLLALHHLAVLRHAQQRWDDSAILCRAILQQRLGTLQHLNRPSLLILAESLLEMGDVRGAYDAIRRLYDQRLSLGEATKLLVLQSEYLARVGQWGELLRGLKSKLQLAELLPPPVAAKMNALSGLAALKEGHPQLAAWLRRRAELLGDVQRLARERPVLWELWSVDVERVPSDAREPGESPI